MLGVQIEYFALPDEDCVWVEDEEVIALASNEFQLIQEAKEKFPVYCEVDYSSEPITGAQMNGKGKVLLCYFAL